MLVSKKIAEILASEYRSTANERNIHRNGFVGFSFVYPKKLTEFFKTRKKFTLNDAEISLSALLFSYQRELK
ncbi:hypothetical protein ALT785_390037 [Alteromonas infernus]